MKRYNKSDTTLYTPLIDTNSTVKSSKCYNTKIFIIILIILFVTVMLCLHNKENIWKFIHPPKDIENKTFINISSNKQSIEITTVHTTNDYCSVTSDDHKFDCFPRGSADKKSCEERNCCWSPKTTNSQIPWCYYPSNYSNYKVINVTKSRNEIVAFFNLTTNTNYKDDIKILCMDVSLQTAQRLRIKVILIFNLIKYNKMY